MPIKKEIRKWALKNDLSYSDQSDLFNSPEKSKFHFQILILIALIMMSGIA